ncbi:hypothetical protein NJB1728f10_23230, partial [Mycobacterium marinum]
MTADEPRGNDLHPTVSGP